MNYDFTFFQTSLSEQREYSTERTAQREILLHLAKHDYLKVEQKGRYEVIATGSHIMDAGNSDGISRINERFNIHLPNDFDNFYRLYNGGYLLFQEIYRLMPVQEIIDWALEMQARDWERKDLPWHLIRFCDLREIGHLALRLCADGQWRVMLADNGYSLHELLTRDDLHKEYTWDDSFIFWLRRMCATDGWPSETHVYVPEDPPLIRL